MITKETARRIYNCYQQIEEIDKLQENMLTEIEKVRENEEKNSGKPIPENSFVKGCNPEFQTVFLHQCEYSIYLPLSVLKSWMSNGRS